jgi:hypothetical protein
VVRPIRISAFALLACLLLACCGTAVSEQPGQTPSSPAEVGEWVRLPTGPLSARREAAGAFVNGRVYVVGGWSDECFGDCAPPVEPPHRDGASFDPVTGHWQQIAPAPTPVGGVLHMTAVGNKLYLLTGDLNRPDSPATFLAYDPDADSWSELPLPPTEHPQLITAGLKLVAIDESDEQKPAEDSVFDPLTSRWKRLPDDPLGPSFGRTAAWLGDQLLLTASDLVPNPGADGPSLTRLAVLDKSLSRWTLLPDSDIIGGNPVWVADRVVFPSTGSADGGKVGNWGRDYFEGAILGPATGTWTRLPGPPNGRSGLEGIIGSVGDRTLVGGHLLDPRTRAWTQLPKPPWGASYRSAQTIVTGPHNIFVWGGTDDKENLADGYLLPLA